MFIATSIALVIYFAIVSLWLKRTNIKATFKQVWFLATLALTLVFPLILWNLAYVAYRDDGSIFGQNSFTVLVEAITFAVLLVWYILYQYKKEDGVKDIFSRKFWKPS